MTISRKFFNYLYLKIRIIRRQKNGPSCKTIEVEIAIMSIFSCFFFSSLRSRVWPPKDPVRLGLEFPSDGSPIPSLVNFNSIFKDLLCWTNQLLWELNHHVKSLTNLTLKNLLEAWIGTTITSEKENGLTMPLNHKRSMICLRKNFKIYCSLTLFLVWRL